MSIHKYIVMKKIFYTSLLSTIVLFTVSLNALAQDIPIDSGLGGNPFGTWAGDTIIIPTLPINGNGHGAPSRNSAVLAIYNQGYIIISTRTEVGGYYAVRNEEQHPVLRGQFTASVATPALIDATSLPHGNYTLLLYIYNECLEGEFEKE